MGEGRAARALADGPDARRARPQTVVDLSWVWALGVVAVCGAVLFGILWRRTLLSNALLRLGVALRASDRHTELRAALSETLSDPALDLLYRDPSTGVWHDASGESTKWPRPLAAHRSGTLLSDGPDDAQIVLIHDVALRDDPELLAAVGGIVVAGRRHEQLTADLAAANIELDESSRRVSEAADVERQRIQRDLHDGAQQRLVALRIRLGLAGDRLASDPVGGMRDLTELGIEVEAALEELRSLGRGAFPAPLVDHGLVAALQALAAQSPLPVRVDVTGIPRLPAELESAVYFTCAEALQNAVKHAAGATSVLITLAGTSDDLRLEVRDDGTGFTPGVTTGHGLGNMRDRIGGVGGTLTVASAPGAGTSVVAVIPLPLRQPATAAPATPAVDPADP